MNENQWHLDKRVPIALIATIFVQTAGIIWWAAGITAQVNANARAIEEQSDTRERLVRIETILERLERRLGEE